MAHGLRGDAQRAWACSLKGESVWRVGRSLVAAALHPSSLWEEAKRPQRATHRQACASGQAVTATRCGAPNTGPFCVLLPLSQLPLYHRAQYSAFSGNSKPVQPLVFRHAAAHSPFDVSELCRW